MNLYWPVSRSTISLLQCLDSVSASPVRYACSTAGMSARTPSRNLTMSKCWSRWRMTRIEAARSVSANMLSCMFWMPCTTALSLVSHFSCMSSFMLLTRSRTRLACSVTFLPAGLSRTFSTCEYSCWNSGVCPTCSLSVPKRRSHALFSALTATSSVVPDSLASDAALTGGRNVADDTSSGGANTSATSLRSADIHPPARPVAPAPLPAPAPAPALLPAPVVSEACEPSACCCCCWSLGVSFDAAKPFMSPRKLEPNASLNCLAASDACCPTLDACSRSCCCCSASFSAAPVDCDFAPS
mmetsp:Transcript_47711/g.120447  ORF Transcript_47711/g.120447 Transcript_47711/m.120447 type:complete len:299 (+) Transcript_47711:438-1334(+)